MTEGYPQNLMQHNFIKTVSPVIIHKSLSPEMSVFPVCDRKIHPCSYTQMSYRSI